MNEKYDTRKNLIYYESPFSLIKIWQEYDKNNRIIHYRNTDRREEYYKYKNGKKYKLKENRNED